MNNADRLTVIRGLLIQAKDGMISWDNLYYAAMPVPENQVRKDGKWVTAQPIPVQGRVAKVEFWLRDRHLLPRIANALGKFDERKLG